MAKANPQAIPATPVGIIEFYFDVHLNKDGLKEFARVDGERWVDFSKQYLAVMMRNVEQQFLNTPADDASVRLFFEPRLRDYWGRCWKPAAS